MTGEMIDAAVPRRIPTAALGLAALLLAGLLVGGLLLMLGGGSGGHRPPARLASSKTVDGEVNLTALTADQLKPLSSRVNASSVRVHPQLVKVAGVGSDGFTVAGDQSGSDTGAAAPSDSQVRSELDSFRRYLRSTPGVPVGAAAAVQPDGTAVAPLTAPSVVAAVIQGGNEIARTPYKWGGGHGAWADTGYDCSGSVSFALAGAGLLGAPLTSGALMSWGAPGPGRWITVYANGGHTFMTVAGLRFDTSGRTGPRGTRWQPYMRSTAGFVARHPPGL